MKIVKLIRDEQELVWRDNAIKICLINEISKNNLFLEKGGGKYQTYNGKTIKAKKSFSPEEIKEIPFSILCSFQNCNSVEVKTIYVDVNDHPFCVWRKKGEGWLEYYQQLFRKFNITEVNFSRDLELYDRVSLLRDVNFSILCREFFDEEFLFYETDFFYRMFKILTSTKLTVELLREDTRWLKGKKIKSILMSIVAIIPTSVEEYLNELKTLDYEFSFGNINELDYLFQVCSFSDIEFILLTDFFLDNNVNFNVLACMEDYDFQGDNFMSLFEKLVKVENQFCVDVYMKLINKFNHRNISDVNISLVTVLNHGENCIREFYNYHSCYVNMFVISKSLFILGISVDFKELKKLQKTLYLDCLDVFLRAKDFPINNNRLLSLIFSFLNSYI